MKRGEGGRVLVCPNRERLAARKPVDEERKGKRGWKEGRKEGRKGLSGGDREWANETK